jgi:transposase
MRRRPEAFADHLRHVGRMSPADRYRRAVLVIDNPPWHRGKPIDEALAANRHLEFDRLPSDSRPLNPVERFWKKWRRRATHNRLSDTPADLKASVRNGLRSFQTVPHEVKTRLTGRPRKTVPK